MTLLSIRKIAMRINETTGTVFIKIMTGEKKAFIVLLAFVKNASIEAMGIAKQTPMKARKSEKNKKVISLELENNSINLHNTSIGVGMIRELSTNIEASCHIPIQHNATKTITEIFLKFALVFIIQRFRHPGLNRLQKRDIENRAHPKIV